MLKERSAFVFFKTLVMQSTTGWVTSRYNYASKTWKKMSLAEKNPFYKLMKAEKRKLKSTKRALTANEISDIIQYLEIGLLI